VIAGKAVPLRRTATREEGACVLLEAEEAVGESRRDCDCTNDLGPDHARLPEGPACRVARQITGAGNWWNPTGVVSMVRQ
jgi:hypothetical protein